MTGLLDGLRVAELATGIAGPYAGLLLAEAGADVVKVETPEGDPARSWGPSDEPPWAFAALNRNKRAMAVDYRQEAGRRLVLDVLRTVDVVLVDAAGEAEAVLPYQTVAREVPTVIYCRFSGYGDRGPWADRPFDELPAQLLSDATASLGSVGEPPIRLGTDVASMYAAIYAAQAIGAALVARDRTGRGQQIDVSLWGSLLSMRSTLWVALSNPDEWWGFHLDNYVKPPFRGYRCRDGYIHFQFRRTEDVDWDALLTALDMQWVRTDPRAELLLTDRAGGTGRYSHVVQDLWDRGLERFTREEATAILKAHGAVVFPVNTYEELLAHPVTEALGIVAPVEEAGDGPERAVTAPWRGDATPARPPRRAPRLGEHTAAVLAQLGWTPEQVDEATRAGLVVTG
ncbi:MAG: CoA transferase [Actinomycetia bacterium]|nr:CoA transferase [Actinomycetes bacterium]